MSGSLTPTQTLILWHLIGNGGSAWLSDIKPKLGAGDRQALERARLVTSDKRVREVATARKPIKARRGSGNVSTRKKVRANWIEVTEVGWAWANDHLSSTLPAKTHSAGPILQAWLTHLHAFLRERNIALADVIATKGLQQEPAPGPNSLEDKITHAYLEVTGGSWKQRVRLSELRRRLNSVGRDALDATLLSMQQASRLVLFRLDNQREIKAEDREAALIIAGEPRHVLHMER